MDTTLWTDFYLYGAGHTAGYECENIMTDFKKIRVGPKYWKLTAANLKQYHRDALMWLGAELEKHKGERNVVVTNHAPSLRSLSVSSKQHVVDTAYASNLDDFILRHSPTLWLHGHLRNNSDYFIGDCRVVCNPRGYAPDALNLEFDSSLVVSV